IPAGTTVTLPSGEVASPTNPVTLALNQVHHDDIPMPIPDGAAPPFAWTLQPSGTLFSPPLPITYPNMSGLAPGSIAYFLTYNHDNFRFEIVSSAHVTSDGLNIVSDPGAGLTKAGWGCNCPPYSVTGDCENCNTVCSDPGMLTASGSATVSKECVCVGQQVTFTAPAVTDSGGEKTEECEGQPPTTMMIAAVTPTYEWEIQRDGSAVASGMGMTVPYTPATPGVYTCTWTVKAARECPPADLMVGPAQSTAVELTGLTVANATLVPGSMDCYVTTNDPPPADVIITATINPMCNPVPADLITWTGGTAGSNNLERKVSRATAANTHITAVCDNTEEVDIHVVDADPLPAANPAAMLSWVSGGSPVVPATAFGLTVVTIGQQGVTAPTYMVTAYLDGTNWRFRVDSITHTYLLGVHSLGRTDISGPGDPSVTSASLCNIIADLTPPGAGVPSGPPRTMYWSQSITLAHENCHVTRFYNAPFWSTEMVNFENAVEAEMIAYDCTNPATQSAAAVIASRMAAWNTSITMFHQTADTAEIGGSEVACHGVSNPMYTALLAAISPTVAPTVPTGVGAAPASATSVTVTWSDTSCNETGFTVQQSSGAGFATAGAVGPGATSFTATGLTTGTAYTFRVIANGAAPGGDSAPSGTATATP
ncbi:MAG: fibronectin type III domain-containing protein, partial [Planctomycetes bacterium]|nr:fibronectin type III domain-containing protein [Planctomycetota bacterium]